MKQYFDSFLETMDVFAQSLLPDVLLAIVYLVFGYWLSRRIKSLLLKTALKTGKIDKTLALFFAGMAKTVILAVTFLVILDTFGVKTTSLIAIFGAAGLAVGLALQGTLSNVASGVMLLMFRPFKVGDSIRVAGHEGTVKEISLFTTEIDSPDNIRIIVPNNAVWGSSIMNLSHHDTRRAQMIFGIGYGEDIEKAIGLISGVLASDAQCLKDPEPIVAVNALNDSSVDILVRVWIPRPDFAATQWAINQKVKEVFDAEKIEIPFPTTTTIHRQEG